MKKKSKILAQNFQVKAIVRTLKEIQESRKLILAWKIFGDIKITVPVKLKIVRSHRNELLFEVTNENFSELTRITTGYEKVNFYIPDGNILFQCRTKDLNNDGGFTVLLPDRIVRQERRKALRCRVDDKDVQVAFQKEISSSQRFNQYFEKNCYDVSVGGLSFIMTQTESKMFKINDKIYFADILMGGKRIDVDLELVNLIPVDPDNHNKLAYRGFKACFQFIRLTKENRNIIDIYVMSNIKFDETG